MKHRLAPAKLAIVETLDGKKVRIVSMDPARNKVKAKSLTSGLPYVTTADQLRLPEC